MLILMSPSGPKWIHIYTETHYTQTPLGCYRGMSLAFSSVVMDTSRHIHHPISRRMLSASEGLAPSNSPLPSLPHVVHPHSLSPSPQKLNPVPYSLKKLPQLQKPSLLLANGGLEANSSYLPVMQRGLLLTDGQNKKEQTKQW